LFVEVFSSIMSIWAFYDFISARGVNEIHQWLNSQEVSAGAKAKINARIASLQGFPIFPEQYFSAYKGWDDLYELRVVFGGVQYRPFGCYGPARRQFTILVGGIEKSSVPKQLLEVACERRKIVYADSTRVRRHDFS
jgi:hypothetical protein